MATKDEAERVGPHWDVQAMAAVRRRTREAIHDIAGRIRPGMVEEDAIVLARELLRERGLLRGWHGTYVRFGPNTVKIYGEPSAPGVILRETDIFLIDIGPVFQRWEGDGGETFTTGDDPDMARCVRDVRALFDLTRARWRDHGATGAELYAFAAEEASRMGWVLNLALNGHRLSDFPHSALWKGPLSEAAFTPGSRLWVLEMHIRHPDGLYGAFYEDMLLDDDDPDF